jgi:hypothetical protein
MASALGNSTDSVLVQQVKESRNRLLVQAGDYAVFNFQPPLLRHLIFFTFPLFYQFV